MVAAVVVALALGAPAPPLTLALTSFSGVQVDAKTANFYGEYFAQQLSAEGRLRVITQAELGALIGMERQRELLGCNSDESSCTAELAGALNADALLFGSVAKVGAVYAVTIKVVSRKAELLAQATARSEESGLFDTLARLAHEIAARLAPSPAAEVRAEARPSAPANYKPLIPIIAGAALAAGGGVCLGLAKSQSDALRNGTEPATTVGQLDAAVGRGQTLQTSGWTLVGIGAAAVAGGVAWWLLDRGPVTPVVGLGSGGTYFGIAGSWP